MKKLLLLLNLILVPVSYFGYRYYKDTPKCGDYSSYKVSFERGNRTILQVVSGEDTISSKEVDEVIDAVPFDPKRCGEPKEEDHNQAVAVQTKPANLNLKLVGICQMGKRSGAIIIDNSRTRSTRPLPRTSRTTYRSRNVRRPTALRVRSHQEQPDNKSSYYRIGDKLSCGYTLKEIKEDSVILAQGGSTFELKLEDAETTSKAPEALPEKRIISAKGSIAGNHKTAISRNRNINTRGHRK